MTGVPIYNHADPIHRQALELAGQYVNCGFLLCSEKRAYATIYINEAFPQYLGYTHEAFMRKFPRFADCIHPEDREYVQRTKKEALQKRDRYDLIYRVRRKNGRVVWIRENGRRALTPEGEKLLFCLLVDISSDMAIRQEIEMQSQTDPLTGILNRAAFVEHVEEMLREAPRNSLCHAFIMLDLDHFKQINDTLGHAYGDRALTEVSQRLKALIRAGDFVGRLGGDEFMLCLRNIPSGDIIKGRMAHICSSVYKKLSGGLALSCSLGIAFYPEDGTSFEELYKCADIALYEAKKTGRNRFAFYNADMERSGFIRHDTPIDG